MSLLALMALAQDARSSSSCVHGVCVVTPLVALTGMRTKLALTLPPVTPKGGLWPFNVTVSVRDCRGGGRTLASANLSLWSDGDDGEKVDDG